MNRRNESKKWAGIGCVWMGLLLAGVAQAQKLSEEEFQGASSGASKE